MLDPIQKIQFQNNISIDNDMPNDFEIWLDSQVARGGISTSNTMLSDVMQDLNNGNGISMEKILAMQANNSKELRFLSFFSSTATKINTFFQKLIFQ